MKRKLQEIEDEQKALEKMQDQVAMEMTDGGAEGSREEADSRSIYVGSVEYAVTRVQLQQHFESCGTVNRVTIGADRYGNPKGFAYLEFLEPDAVSNAVLLDGTELGGRKIKVSQKRTNVPGMKQRGRGRGRGFYSPS